MSYDIDFNIFFIPWLVNVFFNTIVLFYFLHLLFFLNLFQFFNFSTTLYFFFILFVFIFFARCKRSQTFPPLSSLRDNARHTWLLSLPQPPKPVYQQRFLSFFLSLCSTEHQSFSSMRLLTCSISSWLWSV